MKGKLCLVTSDLGDSVLSIFTQNSIENKSIDTNNPLAFHSNSKAIKAKALVCYLALSKSE